MKNLSDFKYIDAALGGVRSRNTIINICDLQIPVDGVDCFATMFRFKEEYRNHVQATGSVRGAGNFACWSDFVYFDIDAETVALATTQMQKLLRGLETLDALAYTQVYLSGNKGYHIGVASGLFGLAPSKDLPAQMRSICEQIASLVNIDIDTRIYNHNRLWRLVDTIHGKSGLRKTRLDIAFAQTATAEEIQHFVENYDGPRTPRYLMCDDNIEATLTRFAQDAEEGYAARPIINVDAFPFTDQQRAIAKYAFEQILLKTLAVQGCRNNEALLRASEGRKLGYDENTCLSLISTWNAANEQSLPEDSIKTVVRSAYTGAGYDFGLNNSSLRLAREQAEIYLMQELIDQFAQPSGGRTGRERENVKTYGELLQEINLEEKLEALGQYISWPGRITLLVGREKQAGKSTIATYEAVQALKKGKRVYWLTPEESIQDVLLRFKAYLGDATEFESNLFIPTLDRMPCTWNEIVFDLIKYKPDMVVLDSVHSVLARIDPKTPDSSDTSRWHYLVSYLRPLVICKNIALIWIHHANKQSNTAIGSVGITAAVDEVITVTMPYGEGPTSRLRTLSYIGRRTNALMNTTLNYVGPPNGYLVHTNDLSRVPPPSHLPVEEGMKNLKISKKAVAQYAAYEWFKENPERWISTGDLLRVCENIVGGAIPRATFSDAIKVICDEGEIKINKKTGAGNIVSYCASAEPQNPTDLIKGEDNG